MWQALILAILRDMIFIFMKDCEKKQRVKKARTRSAMVLLNEQTGKRSVRIQVRQ